MVRLFHKVPSAVVKVPYAVVKKIPVSLFTLLAEKYIDSKIILLIIAFIL